MSYVDTHLLRMDFHDHGLATYPAGTSFGPRRLGDYEFVWLIEGTAEWDVDGTVIPAAAGTILLGRPGMTDEFRWDPRHRTRHGFIHFALNWGNAVLPPMESWPLARLDRDVPVLRPLFQHLGTLLTQTPPGWTELAQGALRQALLAFLMGSGSSGDGVPEEHPLVAAVQDYVRTQWADDDCPPITLGDLARAAGVSKVHLTRVFQAELGMAPVETLRRLRFDRAAGMLARTNLAVARIAQHCGFGDPYHFTRGFRALYGLSPREVRTRARRGLAPPHLDLARIRRFSVGLEGLSTRT